MVEDPSSLKPWQVFVMVVIAAILTLLVGVTIAKVEVSQGESKMPRTIQVQFRRCHMFAKTPTKANKFDSAYDFYVVGDMDFSVLDETPEGCRCSFKLEPGEAKLFNLGIHAAIEEGFGCLLWDRSGMGGKHFIHRLAGVIDGTYRGEWKACLVNLSDRPHVIHEGDRIIQGVFHEVINGIWEEVPELPASIRGGAGFGASGR
jgi:dUTP pyrophosphatase